MFGPYAPATNGSRAFVREALAEQFVVNDVDEIFELQLAAPRRDIGPRLFVGREGLVANGPDSLRFQHIRFSISPASQIRHAQITDCYGAVNMLSGVTEISIRGRSL